MSAQTTLPFEPAMTIAEIAEALEISTQRVAQLETNALRKLRRLRAVRQMAIDLDLKTRKKT